MRRSAPSGHPADTGGDLPRPRPRQAGAGERGRSPLAEGLTLSALLHLLVVVLAPSLLDRGPPPGGAGVEPDPGAVAGTRAIRAVTIVAVDRPTPDERRSGPPGATPAPEAPSPEGEAAAGAAPDPETEPSPDHVGAVPGTGPVAGDPGQRSVARRLAPGRRDPRLWALPPAPRMASSDVDRAHERLARRVEEVLDSMLPAERAARGAVDWTFTDAAGQRWGVTRDSIYVGGRALARQVELPGEFEWGRHLEALRLLEFQIEHARALERIEDRIATIRARKDRERGGN